jgi:hypothetical protein
MWPLAGLDLELGIDRLAFIATQRRMVVLICIWASQVAQIVASRTGRPLPLWHHQHNPIPRPRLIRAAASAMDDVAATMASAAHDRFSKGTRLNQKARRSQVD